MLSMITCHLNRIKANFLSKFPQRMEIIKWILQVRRMVDKMEIKANSSKQTNIKANSLNKMHKTTSNCLRKLQMLHNSLPLLMQSQNSPNQIVVNKLLRLQIKAPAKILLTKINKISLLLLIVVICKTLWNQHRSRIHHSIIQQAVRDKQHHRMQQLQAVGNHNLILSLFSKCRGRMETKIRPSLKVIYTAFLQILTPWHLQ